MSSTTEHRPASSCSGPRDQHAAFLAGLVDDGFIGGSPLGDSSQNLHLVQATSEDQIKTRLAEDPWAAMSLL